MSNKKSSKSLKKPLLALSIVLIMVFLFIGIRVWKYISIGAQVIIPGSNIELKQSEEKRINILLLGVGGGTHDGPDLTDTIIFASIDPKTRNTLLVSIPRDLWSPEISAKINSAYVYGEEKQKDGGLMLGKGIVGKIIGQKIDYAVKIDFNGFVKAVDKIGGLDIDVDREFDDYAYPVTGSENETCGYEESAIASFSAQIATGSAKESEIFPCRYEHLHFDQGQTHMDGEIALKYVRSRHALGAEGSDFARSKRQEKIISAFKDKIFSLDLLLNPSKILDLINVVKESIVTDIKEEEYDDFIRLAQKFQSGKITSGVIDTGDYASGRTGLLINPSDLSDFHGQWVLIPKSGNGEYKEIQLYIKCLLENNCPSPSITQEPT